MPTSLTDLEVVTDHDLELFFMIEELDQVGCEHSSHFDRPDVHFGPVIRAIRLISDHGGCPAARERMHAIFWVCESWWIHILVCNVVCAHCGTAFSQKDYEVVMTREV